MHKRILVIGTSGSGKSSLAKRLSELLQLPFFPTDPFYWQAGWKPAPMDQVRQQVSAIIARDEWILDGNFDDEHEWIWKQADCIVWLDYSLPVILGQAALRNLRWTVSRQTVWSGNRMTVRRAILGVRHAFRSYALKKESYPVWLSELSGAAVYRFRTKAETEAWLRSLQ